MVSKWIQAWNVVWYLKEQEVLEQVGGGVVGQSGESNVCSGCSTRKPKG